MSVLALAACAGCGPDNSCLIERVLERHIGGRSPRDCGSVELAGGDAALQAAHDCMAEALGKNATFVVQWQQQGFDSDVAAAYLSLEPGVVERYDFDGDPSGGGDVGPVTTWQTCTSIEKAVSCDAAELSRSLCFDCALEGRSEKCDHRAFL